MVPLKDYGAATDKYREIELALKIRDNNSDPYVQDILYTPDYAETLRGRMLFSRTQFCWVPKDMWNLLDVTFTFTQESNGYCEYITEGAFDCPGINYSVLKNRVLLEAVMTGVEINCKTGRSWNDYLDSPWLLFREIASKWLEGCMSTDRKDYEDILEQDLYPYIGDRNIFYISGHDLDRCLFRMADHGEHSRPHTAYRMINGIYDLADKACGCENPLQSVIYKVFR
ncbi:MAG: hypothetical protein LUD51_00255 [Clostridia bacterium]|nr:hypothetical protein [Clostridia bacterium]